MYTQFSVSTAPHLWTNCRSCSTVMFTIEQNLCISGPMQFKPMLLRGQLYSYYVPTTGLEQCQWKLIFGSVVFERQPVRFHTKWKIHICYCISSYGNGRKYMFSLMGIYPVINKPSYLYEDLHSLMVNVALSGLAWTLKQPEDRHLGLLLVTYLYMVCHV